MNKITNFLGYIIIGGFLFILSLLNLEKILFLDFNNTYVQLFFGYIIISIIFIIFSKIINFSKELEYITKFITFSIILLIPAFFINHHFLIEHSTEHNLYLRSYGKIAMFYFSITLIISPISSFIKNTKLKSNIIFSRKILGILTFIFFLKHGLEYFALEYIFQVKFHKNISYLDYVIKNLIIRYDALSGFIVGIIIFILGITSNKFSVRLLGKNFKKLQKLVFPGFLIVLFHIAFSSRFDTFYIILLIIVIMFRLAAFLKNNKEKNPTNKVTKKKIKKIIGYKCIPCGYIYDEKLGDPDSGILPGTKFEDIPNTWRCPVCGVTKDDFEPIYEEVILEEDLEEIVGYKMLTDDVLELKIKTKKDLVVKPGQFASITMKDNSGEFTRSYSVVNKTNNILTFIIKLKEGGRGGEFLKNAKIGDKVKLKGIYGKFILQDTENPKIFIATGTGISPILNMINSELKSQKNFLFFGVSKYKDLFYLENIKKVKNLGVKIFLSREEKEGFEYGRIDLTKFKFPKNTEFYICGNPKMVSSNVDFLKKSGYDKIYTEQF